MTNLMHRVDAVLHRCDTTCSCVDPGSHVLVENVFFIQFSLVSYITCCCLLCRLLAGTLQVFSRSIYFKQFCLAHLFTHQAFKGGVLGLAYIAAPRQYSVGGICSEGIITLAYSCTRMYSALLLLNPVLGAAACRATVFLINKTKRLRFMLKNCGIDVSS